MKTCETCKWYAAYSDVAGACGYLSRNNGGFGKLKVDLRTGDADVVIEVEPDFGCTEHEEEEK